MHTCIYSHTHSIPRTEVREASHSSVERGACAGANMELLPSLCTKGTERAGALCARSTFSCEHRRRSGSSSRLGRCTSEVKALIEPVERTRKPELWLPGYSSFTPGLCSTGEERIFPISDPAGNESKDEESCFLGACECLYCSEGSSSFGTEHSKVNSRVNGRNREGTEVSSANREAKRCCLSQTAKCSTSSIKGMRTKILQN